MGDLISFEAISQKTAKSCLSSALNRMNSAIQDQSRSVKNFQRVLSELDLACLILQQNAERFSNKLGNIENRLNKINEISVSTCKNIESLQRPLSFNKTGKGVHHNQIVSSLH